MKKNIHFIIERHSSFKFDRNSPNAVSAEASELIQGVLATIECVGAKLEELNRKQSEIDKRQQEILHALEIESFNGVEGVQACQAHAGDCA